jgi:hypothetical protein
MMAKRSMRPSIAAKTNPMRPKTLKPRNWAPLADGVVLPFSWCTWCTSVVCCIRPNVYLLPSLAAIPVHQYILCLVHDDQTTEDVGYFGSYLAGFNAGQQAAEEDDEACLALYSNDGTRVARFGWGRLGYRQWFNRRYGINSLDDKYDKEVDEAMTQ